MKGGNGGRASDGTGGDFRSVPPSYLSNHVAIVAGMDFAMSAKAADYHSRLTDFMVEHVLPAEASYHAYREEKGPKDHTVPPVVEELKVKAREQGLWNLFLPSSPA